MKKMLCIVFVLFSSCNQGSEKLELEYFSNGSIRQEYIRASRKDYPDTLIQYFQNGKTEWIDILYGVPADTIPYHKFNTETYEIKSKFHNGETIVFDSSGFIKRVFRIKNGLMNGEQREYYYNGQLEVLYNYRYGRLFGLQTQYYENGNIDYYGMYIGDTCVGGFYYFDTLGRVKRYSYFDSTGNVIYIRRYDTLGNVIKEEGDSSALVRVPTNQEKDKK